MTEHKRACCSSPATMCYWFAASLIAWGVPSLIGLYWHPLHGLGVTRLTAKLLCDAGMLLPGAPGDQGRPEW
jgi:hypothetical protein